jgi:hypothetical protein
MPKRPLVKCTTCGTYGHTPGKNCPVHELNLQQEQNAQLGLTPALEAEISRIRSKMAQ